MVLVLDSAGTIKLPPKKGVSYNFRVPTFCFFHGDRDFTIAILRPRFYDRVPNLNRFIREYGTWNFHDKTARVSPRAICQLMEKTG